MKNILTVNLMLIMTMLTCETTLSDEGEVDKSDGHYSQKTGEYHFHPTKEKFEFDDKPLVINPRSITAKAKQDAKADAKLSSMTWYSAGFFFGLIGVGASYIANPTIPYSKLLGKTPNYILIYTEEYKKAMRKERTNQAKTGCILGIGITVLYYLYSTGEL